jgi:hypothetical protein
MLLALLSTLACFVERSILSDEGGAWNILYEGSG